MDLRRRRVREQAEVLVRLAEWLDPAERVLIQSVFDRGLTVAEIAVMRSEPPRPLARRIRRLVRRMLSREYREVARRSPEWPEVRRRVARACILRGAPIRSASRELGLSVHTVREQVAIIRALAESAGPAQGSRGGAA